MKRTLKKSMSIILAFTLLFGSFAFGFSDVNFADFAVKVKAEETAETFTEGYYTYTVDENGNATIEDVDIAINGDIIVPSTLGGYTVTSIGNYAFENCSSLTNVIIPDSVTSIGDGAFRYCYRLTNITVDSANKVYSSDEYGVLFNKDKTELIQYPIGNARKSYEIPDSVTSIGDRSFRNCSSLTNVIIPDTVTSIGDSAFAYCTSLTNITIPNSVTSIGNYAFCYCKSFTSITIPDSVTSLGDEAFYNCDHLTSVTIGNSVTSIGDYALRGCTNLTSVIIPDSVTSIGDGAFGVCYRLTNITVDSANKVYSSDEYGVLFNKDKTLLIQYPIGNTRTSYVIPESVTSIGDRSFRDCSSLTNVIIPDTITSIGDDAFIECDSLTSITIPNSVTSISTNTFNCCYGLTSITIPDSVTSIDDNAFMNCRSLTDVYYTGTEEQWNAISIGNRNECLTNAIIHYNYALGDEPTTQPEAPSTSEPTKPIETPTTNPVEVPTTTKPAETEPSTIKPIVTEPATTKPIEVPTTTKPVVTEPSTTNPVATESSTTKPIETTKPTTAEPTTKPVSTTQLVETTKPTTAPTTKPEPVEEEIIKKPSTNEVKYGETLILHADFENIPDGAKIEWSVEGESVTIKPSEDGKTCAVTSTATGDVTVTAKYTDANGVEHVSEQEIESNASFWQKIVSFFKNLFGINRIIEQVIKF